MEVFELIRDERVVIWSRDYLKVSAESLEEAVEKAKNYEEDSVDCEYLYESLETAKENGLPGPNLEIFSSDTDKLLYSE